MYMANIPLYHNQVRQLALITDNEVEETLSPPWDIPLYGPHPRVMTLCTSSPRACLKMLSL